MLRRHDLYSKNLYDAVALIFFVKKYWFFGYISVGNLSSKNLSCTVGYI